jgi:5-formyltetrahydrofolate cyclo-ligase
MHAAKDELRQKMRRLRLAIDPAEAGRLAIAAAPHVLALPEVQVARRVALYAAVRGELDTGPLQAALAARGVACAYPRIAADGTLDFVDASPASLVPGHHGIPEPALAAPALAPGTIDVFVVPGLAFDLAGERLGWGRGHYDRTLAGAPAALRVGLAYGFQVVPAVPTRADDERMDVVVTEAGLRRTGRPHLRRLR